MRTSDVLRIVMAVGLLCLPRTSPSSAVQAEDGAVLAQVSQPMALQNEQLGIVFDHKTGTLTAVENRLTGETYGVQGDKFEVEAVQFHAGFADAQLVGLAVKGKTLTANYQRGDLTIQARYTLRDHFAEKQLTLSCPQNYDLKKVIVSHPTFSGLGLQIVDYRHPQLGLNKGAEPAHTYFGRTPKGGFFTGVEMSFDASATKGHQVVLGYAPNMKVKANEKIVCEPVYLGVYQRGSHDVEKKYLPLQSESDAMVAMTSTLLPPQHQRIEPMICGWWSETFHGPYTPAGVQHDMRSIDFAVECGIDIISDAHTWAGDSQKVGVLRGGEKLQLDKLSLTLAEYARKKDLRWMLWSSMGSTDPWGANTSFRPDKPEWAMKPDRPTSFAHPTCFAYRPAYDWLIKATLNAIEAGHYGAWGIDGDFFGGPGFDGGPGPQRVQSRRALGASRPMRIQGPRSSQPEYQLCLPRESHRDGPAPSPTIPQSLHVLLSPGHGLGRLGASICRWVLHRQ